MLRLLWAMLANIVGNLVALPRVVARRFARPFYVRLELEGEIIARDVHRRWWRRRRGFSLAGLQRLVEDVEAAPKALGLLVRLPRLRVGFATLQALREILGRISGAGKVLVFHLQDVGTQEYYLSAVGTRVLMPEGCLLDLRGLSVELDYFGTAMRRLGVSAEVGQTGPYKNAAERFTRDSMSEETKEVLQGVFDGRYAALVEGIAGGRNLDVDVAQALIDKGPYHGGAAKQAALVDDVAYEEELAEKLAAGRQKRASFVNARRFARRPGLRWRSPVQRRKIAVLQLRGPIIGGGRSGRRFLGRQELVQERLVRQVLGRLKRRRRVAAVVVHIDSPGGSSSASDIIWFALRDLAKEKPVIASLGNVAASGGYYIAVGCDYITAVPSTVTGSIGVIAGKLQFGELLRRLGIGHHALNYGARAGMFSPRAGFDADERQGLAALLEQSYELFLQRVAQGRRMEKDRVHELGQGRVWSGEQALSRGLVDSLGGLGEAIKQAKERCRRRARERFDIIDVRLPTPAAFTLPIEGNLAGPLLRDLEHAAAHATMLQEPCLYLFDQMLTRWASA